LFAPPNASGYDELNYSQPIFWSINMKTLSVSEAKMKLSALVDQVHDSDDEIIITKNGRAVAVLVSLDEFDSWKETIAIRADAALMQEIKDGVAALKKRKAKLYTLDELLG
jgi:prevent-host-death family protein